MLKQLNPSDFLAQFDENLHRPIADTAKKYNAKAVVCFVNITLDSSSWGKTSALPVGPDNTYKSFEEVEGKWLTDLPSQRQYPQNWCDAAELIAFVK